MVRFYYVELKNTKIQERTEWISVVVRSFDHIHELIYNNYDKESYIIKNVIEISLVTIDVKNPFSENIFLVTTKEKINGVRSFRYILTDYMNDMRQIVAPMDEGQLLFKV